MSVLPTQGFLYKNFPPAGSPIRASIIFLHGLGDTGAGWCQAFQPFALANPLFKEVRMLFPTAPIRPVSLNWGSPMPAWYDIKSLSTRTDTDMDGVDEARQMLEQHIQNEINIGIPPEQIFIGGFSQGAATSLFTSFLYEKKLAGVIALSGYLPGGDAWLNRVREKYPNPDDNPNKNTFLFGIHGLEDKIVRHDWGKASYRAITEEAQLADNPKSTFISVPGMGHEAPQEVLGLVYNLLLSQVEHMPAVNLKQE